MALLSIFSFFGSISPSSRSNFLFFPVSGNEVQLHHLFSWSELKILIVPDSLKSDRPSIKVYQIFESLSPPDCLFQHVQQTDEDLQEERAGDLLPVLGELHTHQDK